MKKKVTVLIIDDVDQSKIIDALKKQLKRKCEFEAISIRTTDVELREDGSDHLDVRKLKERRKDLISSKHINWALTDCILSEDDIDGINVVEILTELRKNLKIIMYSGNRNAVVKRVLGKVKLQEATEEEIVEAVRKLMEYQIIDYVKRDEYKDKLIGLINRDDEPTVHDYFLELFRQDSEMEFISCYAPLLGKSLGDIADMIEKQSDKRVDSWTQELVEQTIAYLVKINE